MRISEFAFLFTKALNPMDYKMLMTRRKRDTMKYFFFLLLFSIVLGGILSLPLIINLPKKVESTLSKFETFNITGIDIVLKEPVSLLNFPNIVLDLTESPKNMTNEAVFITRSDISWKKFEPDLFAFRLFSTNKKPVSEYSDVIQDVNHIKGAYGIIFLFLLPSLLFTVFVLNFLKYMFFIFLLTGIAFLITRFTKKKTKLFNIWRTAVYSSTLFVVIEVSLSPLFNLGVLPILLYIFMFVICMMAVSVKDFGIDKQDE